MICNFNAGHNHSISPKVAPTTLTDLRKCSKQQNVKATAPFFSRYRIKIIRTTSTTSRHHSVLAPSTFWGTKSINHKLMIAFTPTCTLSHDRQKSENYHFAHAGKYFHTHLLTILPLKCVAPIRHLPPTALSHNLINVLYAEVLFLTKCT